jgi:hypothetical protein
MREAEDAVRERKVVARDRHDLDGLDGAELIHSAGMSLAANVSRGRT